MSQEALSTFRFPAGVCIAQAAQAMRERITLTSSALTVMTDLTQIAAAAIHPDANLAEAEERMKHAGVRMLFVCSKMPCVEGIVTLVDLQGEHAMRMVNQRGVRHRDIRVEDVMSPLQGIDFVDMDMLEGATVGQLVATLQRHGRRHLLVAERATRGALPCIRGIISHAQVQRELGQSIPLLQIANTFAEIATALA